MLKVETRFRNWGIGLVTLGFLLLAAGIGQAAASNAATYVLVFPILVYTNINQFDAHSWASEPWGGTTALAWKNLHGRDCLQAAYTAASGTESYIRTDQFFAPEDWSAVTQIKLDVFVENGKPDMGLRIELHDINDNDMLSATQDIGTIPANTWTTVTLNVTPTGFQTAKLFLIPTNMATGNSVCFSNLRIHRTTDEMWDTMDNPSYGWAGSGDFAFWQTNGNRNEPISHSVTYNNSAGALYIPWTFSSGNAAVKTTNLYYQNFVNISKFQAWVYSTQVGTLVSIGFWKDADPTDPVNHPGQWAQTGWAAAASANTWQLMEWDRPAASFDWANPTSFQFIVNTTAGGSGAVYIDNLQFIQ